MTLDNDSSNFIFDAILPILLFLRNRTQLRFISSEYGKAVAVSPSVEMEADAM